MQLTPARKIGGLQGRLHGLQFNSLSRRCQPIVRASLASTGLRSSIIQTPSFFLWRTFPPSCSVWLNRPTFRACP
jgi:hypothetical protein